ncbi:MAG: response regulator transcription factor [Chloroflexota bacterium]|nr:response regulator transcription factor [Chloroflexota bacterium]
MIRLLLVEDHVSFRQALAFLFEYEPDFTVVAQAGSVAETRGKLQGIDVAILDIDLPDGTGVELIRELHETNPHCMVLVLTGSASNKQLAEAVEAGAAGVMYKTAPLEEIIGAARRVGAGEQLLVPREIIQMLHIAGEQREREREAKWALESLTRREREVLQALAHGLNDKEIAQRLRISVETARNHMAHILSKLGVESRLQALVFALRHGAVRLN